MTKNCLTSSSWPCFVQFSGILPLLPNIVWNNFNAAHFNLCLYCLQPWLSACSVLIACPVLNLPNRPSQYSLCVLRLPRTSFASSSSQCNGYSSPPVPTCGCNTFGTQVKPNFAFLSFTFCLCRCVISARVTTAKNKCFKNPPGILG